MGKKIDIQNLSTYGKKAPVAAVGFVIVLGAFYLYATNKVAVQGYAIRSAEKEIARLKQDNNQLRIQEAELKSLYRIEESGKRLNMFEPENVSYIEDANAIALR